MNTQKIKYLVTGRLSGGDDLSKIINATNKENAESAFKNFIMTHEGWSPSLEIYINQITTLKEALDKALTADTIESLKSKRDEAVICEQPNMENLYLVIAYDIATSFNPFTTACILDAITGQGTFEVNEEDSTITVNDEEVLNTSEPSIYSFYFLLNGLKSNTTKLLEMYHDNEYFLMCSGECPKSSTLELTELKAFPKGK